MTDVLERGPGTDDEAICQVGILAALLGVNTEERQVLPDLFNQPVKVQILLTTDYARVRAASQSVHFFNGERIDFVVDLNKHAQ